MRLGVERAYDLFAPELARAALVDHAADLVRWERGVEVFEQVFGQSVLVTEGAAWQRQRRMLQAAFTPRRVAGYAELMVDAASSVLDAAVPQGQAQASVDMGALFSRLTMDVILRFGAGPRVCLGQHFALLETSLAAALLLQRYDIEAIDERPPAEPVLNVTLRPRQAVHLRLRRRQNAGA